MKTLALIAHDHQKVDLVSWAQFNRELLSKFRLVATRHTGRLLVEKVGLSVETVLSGGEGGDTQIAAMVANKEIDVVFFFVDPLASMPHDPDIRALMRVCNVRNVPLATNLAAADLIIAGFNVLNQP